MVESYILQIQLKSNVEEVGEDMEMEEELSHILDMVEVDVEMVELI